MGEDIQGSPAYQHFNQAQYLQPDKPKQELQSGLTHWHDLNWCGRHYNDYTSEPLVNLGQTRLIIRIQIKLPC
eukprot:1156351-Pelagomonas_calceolata.AAC.1